MRQIGELDALLLAVAAPLVLVERVAAGVVAAARWVDRRGPLLRLRAWMARQSPARALPLFLVPELASRSGTLTSAWLLVTGHGRRGIAVYLLSKATAGLAARWVYSACKPALSRFAWFVAVQDGAVTMRGRLARRFTVSKSSRLDTARQRVRSWLPGSRVLKPLGRTRIGASHNQP